MASDTKIGWTHILGETGATWNPIRARAKGDIKNGWFCIKVSEGCKNCYAELLNVGRFGNGLEYKVTNLDKVEMELSGVTFPENGQTAIDWPLRAKKSQGIFPCSMTDWMGEFFNESWSAAMLAVMSLAQHHIFLPLTKRPERMFEMLKYYTLSGMGIKVPDGKVWDMALLKAMGNSKRWEGGTNAYQIGNNRYDVMVPWPPPNVYFGVTICNDNEAFKHQVTLLKLKQLNPAFKTWVSYEPALEPVDWEKHGYESLINWLVVGGESGDNAREMDIACVDGALAFGQKHNIPVYIKQYGTVLGEKLGLGPKGIATDPAAHQFPDVSKAYIPWK